MSYPTLNFLVTSAEGGVQPIAQASATQSHPLGKIVTAQDATYGEGEFIYLAGVASTAKGDLVCFNSKTGATVRAVDGGSDSNGPCAIAMADTVAGQFGWYQLSGSGPINAATTAANTEAYLTSTAGQIDDTGSASIAGMQIKSATSAGFATVQLNRPSVNSATQGVISFASVGSSPSAAGASIAGATVTLQPADGTHPGLLTAGAQTIGGTKTLTALRVADYGAPAAAAAVQGMDVSTGNTYVRAPAGGGVNLGANGSDSLRVADGNVVRMDLVAGTIIVLASTDTSGSPGAATANTASGRSAIASGSGSAGIDFTCSVALTAASRVFITPRAIDGTAPLFKAVCSTGKFTVTTYSAAGVAANVGADWAFDWLVLN